MTTKWSVIRAAKGATHSPAEGSRRVRAQLLRRAALRAVLIVGAATLIAAFLWAMNVLGASL